MMVQDLAPKSYILMPEKIVHTMAGDTGSSENNAKCVTLNERKPVADLINLRTTHSCLRCIPGKRGLGLGTVT